LEKFEKFELKNAQLPSAKDGKVRFFRVWIRISALVSIIPFLLGLIIPFRRGLIVATLFGHPACRSLFVLIFWTNRGNSYF
jgi:hypothetical protein